MLDLTITHTAIKLIRYSNYSALRIFKIFPIALM